MSIPIPTPTVVLILGGTSEASALAVLMAKAGVKAVFSYAGRVGTPRAQPLPTRIGGFGGVTGLVRYLQDHAITHVVDATHPFATGMSRNAVDACAKAGVPLVALTRPAWQVEKGDQWRKVADINAAVKALDGPPRRVFLALGRMHLAAFAARPLHHYLLRLVDRPQAAPLPDCHVILARGPFDQAGDIALLQDHNIDLIVCKNSGGEGAKAKLVAARALHLPVLMIARPIPPECLEYHQPQQVLDWLARVRHPGTDLGV
ncbi:MAG: cobalt-precorrin-6A reductase [Rhodobacteraceae bacterium]|nr:cobalt-precorrin-6A reductase [Paracoccaceae bacterium]